jgi:hypothetical protein
MFVSIVKPDDHLLFTKQPQLLHVLRPIVLHILAKKVQTIMWHCPFHGKLFMTHYLQSRCSMWQHRYHKWWCCPALYFHCSQCQCKSSTETVRLVQTYITADRNINPFLFIRGLSCPSSVQASLTQNCLKLTIPGFPYNCLPVFCGEIGF